MSYSNISSLFPTVCTDDPHELCIEVWFLSFTVLCALTTSVSRSKAFPFRVFQDVLFLVLPLLPEYNPSHDARHSSFGNHSMFVPRTELITCALVFSMPGISWITFAACFSYIFMKLSISSSSSLMMALNSSRCLSRRRNIFRWMSVMILFRSSMICSFDAFRLCAMTFFS